ncbi:MAG: DNA starvation/stationary phase protection protein [Bacteroidota bacterium]
MNYLGLDPTKLSKTTDKLNQLLSSYHIYYQNLRNFHWNVTGENFFELHAQFEALYNDARLKIDEVAERILTLRHRPISQFSDYLNSSEVQEAGEINDDIEMVKIILDNHRILISQIRDVIKSADDLGDDGTLDMMGTFLEGLEKKSWMLDAFVSRKGVLQN